MLPTVRGRLIFPFVVELAQLDTAATDANGGSLGSGFDEVFREPVKIRDNPNDQIGVSVRVETLIQVRAQIEPDAFEKLEAMLGGDAPASTMSIVCHYRDLERAGLVDSDGRPLLRKNDRLSRILDTRGNLVESIPNPPGLFCLQVQSRGFGPGGRNLLLLTFGSRDTSTRQ